MDSEAEAPKKRGRKKKVVLPSEETLEVLSEAESSVLPKKAKRARKTKVVREAEPVNIVVKHAKTIPLASSSGQSDPFSILDKELEYKDFFNKYEKSNDLKRIPQVKALPELNVDKIEANLNDKISSIHNEDFRKETIKQSFNDDEFESKPVSPKFKRFSKRILGIALITGIAYVGYISVYPFFLSKKDALTQLKSIAIIANDETPIIYKVTGEAELLKNPSFKNILENDTIFLFQKTGVVYVYRESENKIVTIVPILGKPEENKEIVTEGATPTASTTNASVSTSALKTSTSTKATTTSKTSTTTRIK